MTKFMRTMVAAGLCGGAFAEGGFVRVADDNFTFETAAGDRFLPMGAY